jgi:hypothetical protein
VEVGGGGAELLGHFGHCLPRDVLERASPSRMDKANGPMLHVEHKHGHTVGHEYRQRQAGNIREKTVGGWERRVGMQCAQSAVALAHAPHTSAMDLLSSNQVGGFDSDLRTEGRSCGGSPPATGWVA